MKYKLKVVNTFNRESKRLIRKYPSLRFEIENLGNELIINPFQGTPIGKGFYKIRVSIKSKGKGKRAGGRVITFIKVVAETVYLVSIYDKSEKSDISDADLDDLFGEIEN
jgi:mRNA-degrading endonuclease RelE of RelBE toxin-antitoxin system